MLLNKPGLIHGSLRTLLGLILMVLIGVSVFSISCILVWKQVYASFADLIFSSVSQSMLCSLVFIAPHFSSLIALVVLVSGCFLYSLGRFDLSMSGRWSLISLIPMLAS